MSTCGDFGGRKPDGTPCRRRVKKGLCFTHGGEKDTMVRVNQEEFLAAYIELGSVGGACKHLGTDRTAHWSWTQTDPTYPERFEAATDEMIRIKVEHRREAAALARGLLLERLRTGEASRGEVIFTLKNDPDDPWSDAIDMHHSGRIDSAKEVRVSFVDSGKHAKPQGREAVIAAARMAGPNGNGTNGNGKHNGNGSH